MMARLEREAPGLRIRISQTTKSRELERLDAGSLDLLVGVFPGAPESLRKRALLREGFKVLGRAGPEPTLSLETYVTRPHVLVTLSSDAVGVIDARLAEVGLSRNITVTVPHFLAAAWAVTTSDALVTVPARLAGLLADCHGLSQWDPPLDLDTFTVDALWSDRTHGDPLHAWVRDLLRSVCEALPDERRFLRPRR